MQSNTVVGRHYQTGQTVQVRVSGGRIASVTPVADCAGTPLWLAPGLTDLQVNGFLGHDANAARPDPHEMAALTEALWAQGVTGYLPTLVTTRNAHLQAALRSIMEAMDENEQVAQSIRGVHLEGPFISPEDGPRGAHDAAWVRAPDWELFRSWQAIAGGRIRIVTLSPEWEGAPAFIQRCAAAGVRVAIGHTAATPEQIGTAVASGATLSTHLGNGAHASLPRHPNYLWEQLASETLWASFIGDGFHLPAAVMKVILKVKEKRAFLVSDTVALAGLPAGRYDATVGGSVLLTPDGRLCLERDPGLLAGSAQPLLRAVERLSTLGICDFAQAWDLASVRPANYLHPGAPAGLSAGSPADLVLFERRADGIRIVSTLVNGTRVFNREERRQP